MSRALPRPPLTIRMKLLLLVLLASLPAFGVVLHSGLKAERRALDETVADAERTTSDLALRQEQLTASTRQFLATLAQVPQVRALDAEACSRLFAELHTVNPLYSDILLADTQGLVLASAHHAPAGISLADTPSFQGVMRIGAFTVGGYRKSRTTGLDVLTFAYPVRGQRGQLLGVLAAGMRLDIYADMTRGMALPPDSTLFMADRDGLRLYNRHYPDPRPDLFPLGEPVTIKQRGILHATAPGQTNVAAGLDGKPRLYIVRQASQGPGEPPYFTVGISLTEHTVQARTRAALLHDLILMGLAVGMVAALGWLLGKRSFVNRIERLAFVAGRFARGDFSARADLADDPDELGQLAVAMDHIGRELARREAERAATLESLTRTQYAVDHAGDEIYWADKDARLRYVNERACQSLGYSREELLAMGVGGVDAEFDPASWPTLLELLATGGPTTMEVVHKTKTGELVPKELTVGLVDSGGELLIFGSARDIRERKRHEAVLRSLVDETAALTGPAFFETLTGLMVRLLDADAAFAAEYADTPPTLARTLAFHTSLGLRPPFEYTLTGTPCADIPEGGHLFIPDGLLDRYPNEPELRRMGIQSYLGVALHDASGLRIGHLVILSARPMAPDPQRLSTMRLFAVRAGAELERMRTERSVLSSLREKEVLLKEIHHRVKNNLQIVCSLLALQAGNVSDPTALALLEESRARIMSMALVHEDLYQSDDLALVDIRRYMSRLAERVACSLASCQGIGFRQDIAPLALSIDQAIPLGLLANELLTNALKHAFPGGREGSVTLSLAQDDGRAVFEVRDDGVGLPDDFQPGGGGTLGMQLVWTLADQLHGQIGAQNDGGAVFTLRFPLAHPPRRSAPPPAH